VIDVDPVWLDELSDFIRIPSVSADPAHAGDVRRAAEWLREFVARTGHAELVEWGARPLVIGEIAASSAPEAAPTVLAYGHFDVQPPAPLELWHTAPFELASRDGWLYARGVADDKGQLYMLLKAAESLAHEGRLPVNVRVACDGEEEVGGHSIVDFLAEDPRGADACVIFDSLMERRGLPTFCTGTRGLVAFDMTVKSGERDLHSGMFGNAALNATHALIEALSGILPREGRLPEPLRAGVVPPSAEEEAAWSKLQPGAAVLEQQGAVPYDERASEEFWLRTTSEPSVDVNGILGGKPGLRNTTIPVGAQANFTIRLAPGQDTQTVGHAAERLLREAAPPGANVDVTWDGTPPGLVSPHARPVQLGLDAFERVVGVRPLLARLGGTLPIIPALADKGIPTLLTGFALPESNIHSPNERLLLEYLPLGVAAARELFVSLAELRD
jgi:acetylornithine deacetylase/succinyl-diaminopimelate desuccinylase-like protein